MESFQQGRERERHFHVGISHQDVSVKRQMEHIRRVDGPYKVLMEVLQGISKNTLPKSLGSGIQTANKYVDLDYLDAYALHELIQGIYVDTPDKSSGHRVQHIHIKYNGLGFIPLDKLLQKETA